MYFSDTKFGCAYRLHPNHSVIYSELFAIKKSLIYVEVYTSVNFVVFFSVIFETLMAPAGQKG